MSLGVPENPIESMAGEPLTTAWAPWTEGFLKRKEIHGSVLNLDP